MTSTYISPGAGPTVPARSAGESREAQGGVVALLRRTLLEGALVATLLVVYNAGRLAIAGQEALARANAEAVRRLEAILHLPSEAAIQRAVANVPHVFEAANHYYMAFHFPVVAAFLLWGFFRRPRAEYVWARRLLAALTFMALVLHVAVPLAPPRMFPGWGFTDTMTLIGPSPYDGASAGVANQFAAMPSLHIGWALLIAYVVWRTGPRWLSRVATVHAALTVLVVVVTANHWWLDGVVVAGLLAIAVRIVPAPRGLRPHTDSPGPATPAPDEGNLR